MRKHIIMLLVLAAGLSAGGCSTEKALSVNDVANRPADIKGRVVVTGVMAARSRQDPMVFGIFDTRELKCTTPNCNRLILPVRYQGELPAPGDEVRLTGSVVNYGRGFLFAADKLKVVKNHKLGG